MFTNVSWPTYLLVVLMVLVFYYLYVALRYYVFDLKALLNRKRQTAPYAAPGFTAPDTDDAAEPLTAQQTAFYDTSDDTFDQIEDMIAAVKTCITEAAGTNIQKDELIASFKKIFQDNLALKNSPYQEAINELILTECENHQLMFVQPADIAALWS